MTSPKVKSGRTLIIQPLPGIGDVIWHLRHIHAIAATTAQGKVSILTKPRSKADLLLIADPTVEEVLWVHRNPGKHAGEHDGVLGLFRLARLLRRGRFDTVWILHNSTRYAQAAWLAGIPKRIGLGVGAQKWFLNHAVMLPEGGGRGHPIEKATKLLELNGLDLGEKEASLPVSADATAHVNELFAARPKPWIGIGIGSSEAHKQWGQENFIALAKALNAPEQRTLFLLGGPGEAAMVEAITKSINAAGGTIETDMGAGLDRSVALTAQCSLYIGNDTGLLNVAAALAVDAIGLFGGSPPLSYSKHIHSLLPEAGKSGMAGISVAQVVAEAAKFGIDCGTSG